MRSPKSFFGMFRAVFRSGKIEDRLRDELQLHVDMLAEKNMRLGMSADEAQRRARIAVGGFDQTRETVREARGFRWLDDLARDLRYARHILWKQKALSLIVIALLAVASAANTAIFSVYNFLYLRSLPFPHADRLVEIDAASIVAHPEENRSFEAFGFYNPDYRNYSRRGSAGTMDILNVTWSFPSVFEIRPVIGRGFLEKEDRPGEPKVVMLGYRFWQREFGGSPSALGETVKLDGEPHTVVGVLPESADFPQKADVWVLFQADWNAAGWFPRGMGRLKEGVTLATARADMARIDGILRRTRPANETFSTPKLTPLGETIFGRASIVPTMLLFAAGILLLIICFNITGMMLARSEYRTQEMGIRTALGASRSAIIRQLLTESLSLTIPGVLIGLLAGQVLLDIIVSRTDAPSWVRLTPDIRMLAFCALLTGAATILFGLAPALQAARIDVQHCLHEAGSRSSAGRSRRRGLKILVAGEVALAVVMLVGAGLLLRAWQKTVAVDPGFRAENVFSFNIKPPSSTYRNGSERFYDRLLARLRQLPGVTAVSGSNVLPLAGAYNEILIDVEGTAPAPEGRSEPILLRWVFPGYFKTMAIPLLAGRDFDDKDGATIDMAATIVDQSFARRYWPDTNPVGKRIRMKAQSYGRGVWGGMEGVDQWMTVVGVTRDTVHRGLDKAVQPGIYVPNEMRAHMGGAAWMYVIVRSAVPSAALFRSIRSELDKIDPGVGIFDPRTMTEVVNRSMLFRRLLATVMTIFAAGALLIATAGVYGVVSYNISRRTHEIGIRMALGATRGQVLGMVVGGGTRLVIAGAVLGIAGAIVASRAMQSMLFGITPYDVPTYLAVVAVLAGVVAAATLLPARRAVGIEPMRALRSE